MTFTKCEEKLIETICVAKCEEKLIETFQKIKYFLFFDVGEDVKINPTSQRISTIKRPKLIIKNDNCFYTKKSDIFKLLLDSLGIEHIYISNTKQKSLLNTILLVQRKLKKRLIRLIHSDKVFMLKLLNF
jgi:hypothetical protein